jgi:heme-degrading monooxygenase HmoA
LRARGRARALFILAAGVFEWWSRRTSRLEAGAYGDPRFGAFPMFIAMNRFNVLPGQEKAFEAVWLGRDTHLGDVPGFVAFDLLRGPTSEEHTLYASHTLWRSHDDFEAWTRSEAFRAAHKGAGDNKPLYLGHPQFEGFEVIQEVRPS